MVRACAPGDGAQGVALFIGPHERSRALAVGKEQVRTQAVAFGMQRRMRAVVHRGSDHSSCPDGTVRRAVQHPNGSRKRTTVPPAR